VVLIEDTPNLEITMKECRLAEEFNKFIVVAAMPLRRLLVAETRFSYASLDRKVQLGLMDREE
jgi:hypothetical protein